jgi:rubrerythrin
MLDLEGLVNIFKVCAEKEPEAQEFYLKAAADTSDPEARKIFEELAQTEHRHEQVLIEKYRKLRETVV